MIAETICTIISFIEEKENTEHRIIKRYYSVLNNDMPFIEFYFLNKSIKSLNEEKDTKWSKISKILLNPATFSTIIRCTGGSCGSDLDRKYRRSYRDTNCPCQSCQLHEDTDDNGTYETLVLEAAGWTGSCL